VNLFRLSLISLLIALAVSACASPERRINDNPTAYSKLTPAQQELVRKGDIAIDMPDFGVELALGKPDTITERTEAKGTVRIWHYKMTESTTAIVDYVGFYDPFFFPSFAPVIVNNAQPAGDRIRVFFDSNKVVAIERELTK